MSADFLSRAETHRHLSLSLVQAAGGTSGLGEPMPWPSPALSSGEKLGFAPLQNARLSRDLALTESMKDRNFKHSEISNVISTFFFLIKITKAKFFQILNFLKNENRVYLEKR